MSSGLVDVSDERRSRSVSTDALRYMQHVFSRTISAHSGVMTVPPPSASTAEIVAGTHPEALCAVFLSEDVLDSFAGEAGVK